MSLKGALPKAGEDKLRDEPFAAINQKRVRELHKQTRRQLVKALLKKTKTQ